MCLLAVTTATKITDIPCSLQSFWLFVLSLDNVCYLAHDLAVFMRLAPGQALWFWLQWLHSVVLTGFRLCLSCIDTVLYNIFNVCVLLLVLLHSLHASCCVTTLSPSGLSTGYCVIGVVMDLPVTLPLFLLWGHSGVQ